MRYFQLALTNFFISYHLSRIFASFSFLNNIPADFFSKEVPVKSKTPSLKPGLFFLVSKREF